MHRNIAILVVLALICGGISTGIAGSEVIDRIVAVVDGRTITLSDIRSEHEIQAVLGDPSETDEDLLKSMIDRSLMEEEMTQFPSLDISVEEVDERMKAISNLRGVNPSVIRDAIIHKLQRRRYLDLRYRQFIVVSSEEIEKEYDTVFVPEAVKRGIAAPELKVVESDLRMILFEKKLSQEVEESLQDLRARSNIERFY